MLLVHTYLADSPIHGRGVFAAEDIPAGALVWKFDFIIDKQITPADFALLPLTAREHIKHYGYFDLRLGVYVLCCDHASFTNHSRDPNTVGRYRHERDFGVDVTTRAIARGEEITCDYGEFDAEFNLKIKRAA